MSRVFADLSSYQDYLAFTLETERLCKQLNVSPQIIAHDMHPDYISTRYALRSNISERIAVQHHHAHIAACMTEHGLTGPVIGVALDGTGYGPDGTVWGGEFFVADLHAYRRAGHFKQYPMPGGEEAVRRPDRMALSCLAGELPDSVDRMAAAFLPSIHKGERNTILSMIRGRIMSPLTSSAGRLFDAASALLGICSMNTHSGEAAIKLQKEAETQIETSYEFEIQGGKTDGYVLSFGPAIRRMAFELEGGVSAGRISGAFHNTLADAICALCIRIAEDESLDSVAVGGGVFLNPLLRTRLLQILSANGLRTYAPDLLSPGDESLSLGQAAIALSSLLEREDEERFRAVSGPLVVHRANCHEKKTNGHFPGYDAHHERFPFLVGVGSAKLGDQPLDNPSDEKRPAEHAGVPREPYKKEHRMERPTGKTQPE